MMPDIGMQRARMRTLRAGAGIGNLPAWLMTF